MKVSSYSTPTRVSFGIVDEDRIYDLGCRIGGDLKGGLTSGKLGEAPRILKGATADFHLDEVVFLPVVPNPGKIICVGLNYLEHRLEGAHSAKAEAPALFTRFAESQTGHLRPLICPAESEKFDFEAEMAIIIGRAGRRIREADALSYVAGVAPYNDGSVRDWQLAANQWTPGKNFPATGAFGPWMSTPDEAPPDANRRLVCRLNGVEMQNATTDMMMFKLRFLISHISAFTTLEPGDVIVSGTPGGVGLRRNPPVWMKEGDVVEVDLEGVGILRNVVRKEIAA